MFQSLYWDFFKFIYLAALGLNCDVQDLSLWHVGSSPLTRDRTQAPCIGNSEAY